jgi:GNAT superfamily N-acetyltransferase
VNFQDISPSDPRLLADVHPVLAELRTGLSPEALRDIYTEGHAQGLRFTAVYDEGRCIAVAGWRVMATTVATRKLYVDDLVTAASHRGRGVGAAMLAELQERARDMGAQVLDLDSGMQRSGAHRFYVTNGMAITSLHFSRALQP